MTLSKKYLDDLSLEYDTLNYITTLNSRKEYEYEKYKERKFQKNINRNFKIKLCFPDLQTVLLKTTISKTPK